jgi:nicotinate phosphoribosyltransferase
MYPGKANMAYAGPSAKMPAKFERPSKLNACAIEKITRTLPEIETPGILSFVMFDPPGVLHTDFYQITITRMYFEQGRQDEPAVFDLFYRKQPFRGSICVFAGLADALQYIQSYRFTESELEYVRENLPGVSEGFIQYLRAIDLRKLTIRAIPEGTVVFPREPLLSIQGPIAYCQLIETPLLNFINYATLMTTNALRFRLRAGDEAILMEFGLRRAQGPNGALSASKYAYMGTFNSTSNVQAGHRFQIPIAGTVAHSFITSYHNIAQLTSRTIPHKETGEPIDLWEAAHTALAAGDFHTNQGELVAFVAQAQTFPNNFLTLADTYDTLKSGVPNFLAVAYGLHLAGYQGKGIRLDSGDLSYLSKGTRQLYREFAERHKIPNAANFLIAASNDINEEELIKLKEKGHEINSYGIGTHLVTCQKQPALGGVYKLVDIGGLARIKVSETVDKTVLPGQKTLWRLYDETGKEVADYLTLHMEEVGPGDLVGYFAYGGVGELKVSVASALPLYTEVWKDGVAKTDALAVARQRVLDQRQNFNPEVMAVVDQRDYPVLMSRALHTLLSNLIETARKT